VISDHSENLKAFKKKLGSAAENSRIMYSTDGRPAFISFDGNQYRDFAPFSERYGCFFTLWIPSNGFASDQVVNGIIEVDFDTKRVIVKESPGSRRLSKTEQKHVPLIGRFLSQHIVEIMAEDKQLLDSKSTPL
jgi:hypothetical protein